MQCGAADHERAAAQHFPISNIQGADRLPHYRYKRGGASIRSAAVAAFGYGSVRSPQQQTLASHLLMSAGGPKAAMGKRS